MSWTVRRSLVLFAAAVLTGLGSAFIWPGDLDNEPMTWGHRVAVGGFLLMAILLVLAAIMLLVAVVGSAWKVDDFDPNAYFEDMTDR